MTIRANPGHFLVDLFVDMVEKSTRFLGKTAKGYGFEPRPAAQSKEFPVWCVSLGASDHHEFGLRVILSSDPTNN
jgi:hypothetical protein